MLHYFFCNTIRQISSHARLCYVRGSSNSNRNLIIMLKKCWCVPMFKDDTRPSTSTSADPLRITAWKGLSPYSFVSDKSSPHSFAMPYFPLIKSRLATLYPFPSLSCNASFAYCLQESLQHTKTQRTFYLLSVAEVGMRAAAKVLLSEMGSFYFRIFFVVNCTLPLSSFARLTLNYSFM